MPDEYKFLVPIDGTTEPIDMFLANYSTPGVKVYLQPINSVDHVDDVCLKHVLSILHERPEWNLSCQLHKFINVR